MEEKKKGRPPKTENDKRDDVILELLKKGLKQTQIANELGISNGAISIRLKRMRERGVVIPNDRKIKSYEKDIQIIELLKEGLTQTDIAKRLGMTYGNMRYRIYYLQELGIVTTRNKKVNNDEILKMLNKGLNKTQIAKEMGVTRSTILKRVNYMKKQGIDIPKNNKYLDERDNRIIELSEKGLSQAKIAEVLDVSPVTINSRIKKIRSLGIEIPDKRKNSNKNKDNNKNKIEKPDLNIAQKIVDLMTTKKANVKQVMSIAKIYQVEKEVEKLLKKLDDKER